jgi:hypothetical protein
VSSCSRVRQAVDPWVPGGRRRARVAAPPRPKKPEQLPGPACTEPVSCKAGQARGNSKHKGEGMNEPAEVVVGIDVAKAGDQRDDPLAWSLAHH